MTLTKDDINGCVECEFPGVTETGKAWLKSIFDITTKKIPELEKRVEALENKAKGGK